MSTLEDMLGLSGKGCTTEYRNGMLARRMGKPLPKCPYDPITEAVSFEEWANGWWDENQRLLRDGEIAEPRPAKWWER